MGIAVLRYPVGISLLSGASCSGCILSRARLGLPFIILLLLVTPCVQVVVPAMGTAVSMECRLACWVLDMVSNLDSSEPPIGSFAFRRRNEGQRNIDAPPGSIIFLVLLRSWTERSSIMHEVEQDTDVPEVARQPPLSSRETRREVGLFIADLFMASTHFGSLLKLLKINPFPHFGRPGDLVSIQDSFIYRMGHRYE